MEKVIPLLDLFDQFKKDSEVFVESKITISDGICDVADAGEVTLPEADLIFDISEEFKIDYEKLLQFFKYKVNKKYLINKSNFIFFLNNIHDILNTQIKLVIWDLDETLWRGTLSETDVKIPDENLEIINDLLDHGIMNSICSKNNFDQASAKLKEFGVENLFIFPSFEWRPKGYRISNIICSMNLRPENVLFLDDLELNLKEAKYSTPKLNIYNSKENFIDHLKYIIAHSKKDKDRSRLSRYKILEHKFNSEAKYENKKDFLYSCDINLEIRNLKEEDLDRAFEMIHRTNQLNYLKNRWSIKELTENYKKFDSFIISASDKFGDYGKIGLCILDGNKALQFLFSCRIMNMGIENFIYNYFNKPIVEIAPPVAYPLDDSKVDWINLK